MKKFILLFSFISAVLLFISCDSGYVTVQPTYVETVRPIQPGPDFIWIEGDWIWNNHSHSYFHQNGHWAKPNRGRNYSPGRWNNTPRGYQWQRGRRH